MIMIKGRRGNDQFQDDSINYRFENTNEIFNDLIYKCEPY